jgi:hypothetical protein
MSKLSHLVRGAGLAVGVVALSVAAASAEAPPAKSAKAAERPRSCFFITQWRGWKAPTPDVLYLGVNLHDVYKVQLAAPSPELQWPDVHLVSISRGSSTICDVLDLDLKVADGHGVRVALFPKSIVKLTPEEVAAIPPKMRPN